MAEPLLGRQNVKGVDTFDAPPEGTEAPTAPAALVRPSMTNWDATSKCGCDQYGRCLTDCPTAHLPFRDTPLGRRFLREV